MTKQNESKLGLGEETGLHSLTEQQSAEKSLLKQATALEKKAADTLLGSTMRYMQRPLLIFSIVSTMTDCQQQLSSAQGMLQVIVQSALKIVQTEYEHLSQVSSFEAWILNRSLLSPNPKELPQRTERNTRELTPRLVLIYVILLYSIVSTFLQV